MPNWQIREAVSKRVVTQLGNCSKEHAESVLNALMPQYPDGLKLVKERERSG